MNPIKYSTLTYLTILIINYVDLIETSAGNSAQGISICICIRLYKDLFMIVNQFK